MISKVNKTLLTVKAELEIRLRAHDVINQGFLQGQAAVFARINGEWFRMYKMRSS
jgi:hypothetical protein